METSPEIIRYGFKDDPQSNTYLIVMVKYNCLCQFNWEVTVYLGLCLTIQSFEFQRVEFQIIDKPLYKKGTCQINIFHSGLETITQQGS